MTLRVLTWVFAVLLVACGSAGEEGSPPESSEESPDESAAVDESTMEEERIEDPPVAEQAVEDMDERDLEAACFAGRQAACDRLGH